MRRAVYAAILTGLFLLLLSALVVSPETPAAPRALPESEEHHAVFRPLISAIVPEVSARAQEHPETRLILCSIPLILCFMPLCVTRDANGRVLRAARYENSVYQLFRAEVAGG